MRLSWQASSSTRRRQLTRMKKHKKQRKRYITCKSLKSAYRACLRELITPSRLDSDSRSSKSRTSSNAAPTSLPSMTSARLASSKREVKELGSNSTSLNCSENLWCSTSFSKLNSPALSASWPGGSTNNLRLTQRRRRTSQDHPPCQTTILATRRNRQ